MTQSVNDRAIEYTDRILNEGWIQPGSLAAAALTYAFVKHDGQKRREGADYIHHPVEVARRLVRAWNKYFGLDIIDYSCPDHVVAAAILHDTVEDTDATFTEIYGFFGPEVCELVFWLSEVTDAIPLNRKMRVFLTTKKLASAPPEAKAIKWFDIEHNLHNIESIDPKFAAVYVPEKQLQRTALGRPLTNFLRFS